MSLNNPEINRGNAGNTVYIDPTAITEMPTQIMQQDLDPLVGLNLHPSDLESLHMTTDEQVECINDGNILPSSNSSVGDIVHVPDSAMDTSEAVGVNSMDSEVLPENVLNDIGLLTDSQDFIPIMSNEEVLDLKPPQQQSGLHLGMSPNQDVLSPSVEPTPDVSSVPGTHILKFNSGQFIVLQPNQNSQQVNLNNKSFSSSNLVFSSLPSNSVPKITKPTLVNSNQVLTNSILQNSTLNVKTTQAPQFRTLQLKQPISLSTSANSSSMTKVILTSQPGNNLSQQLRLISSQAPVSNATNVKNTLSSTVVSNPSKMTFQLQPIVLSMSSSKSGVNSPVKTEVVNPKPQTDIKMPLTIPLKSLNASIQQMTSLQSNEVTSNVYSQLDPKVSVASSSANQSVFIKPGNIFKTGTGLIKIPISQLQQLAGQNQSLGTQNKLNLRLIPTTVANSVPQTIKNVTTKPVLAPATSSNGRNPKTTVQFTHIHPKQQRVIIPANSASNSVIIPSNTNSAGNNPLQIRPQGSITLPASALNSSVFSNAQPGSLVMIPAQYFQNSNNNSSNNTPVSIQNVSKQVQSKTVIDANVIKPRKPCNCTKSQCLKLYCDCFANGEFCNNCNCVNCFNNLSHEEDRQKAIKCCLERNPQAFRPKIGKGGTDTERRHNKGCNCKRSGCLKNYCECYEAKIPCSNMCRCVGCRNMDSEQPFERKRLMALAEAAEARVHQHSAFKSRQISLSLPSPAKMSLPSSAKNSYCRISQEVVEATCHCLLAQAEKVEKGKMNSPQKMESMVLNEFSHCLLRIIGFNTKVKGSFS